MITKSLQWTVLENAEAVADTLVQRILLAAEQALSHQPYFRIVLAGGSTPALAYQRLAKCDIDWSRWEIYYGDERCLPVTDSERNSVMAKILTQQIPAKQVFPIPAELGAEQAAKSYSQTIKAKLPFDLVLLGMGEDGHTASLFPDHHHDDDQLVHPIYNAPKPPPERVSLSAKALNNSQQVTFVVTGENKRSAVAAWQQGADLPVKYIMSMGRTEVLLDKQAAIIA